LKHFKNTQNLSKYYSIELKHPLIDILKYGDVNSKNLIKIQEMNFDFYTISFVKNFNRNIQIGRLNFKEKMEFYIS